MDKSVIKDSLGQVERELEDAQWATRQLEAEIVYEDILPYKYLTC